MKNLVEPKMWALYDQTVVSGCNFILMLGLARALGNDSFGLVSLAYLSTLFLTNHQRAFFTQPMNVLGVNDSRRDSEKRFSALLCMHVVWLSTSIVFILCIGIYYYPYPKLIFSVCVYVCLSQIQELIRRAWYTEERCSTALLNTLINYFVQIIVLFILFSKKALTVETAFIAMALGPLAGILFSRYQGIYLTRPTISDVKSYAHQHWNYGRWLVYGVFAIWGSTQLYPFMLAATGLAAVGALAACRNLLNGISVLLQTINSYLPSHIRRMLKTHSEASLRKYFRKLTIKVGGAAVLFCGTIAIFSQEILHKIYGENYADASTILRILAIGTFFAAVSAVPTNALMALGKTRDIFNGNLHSTIFSLSGGWWLVSRYGLEGAAVSIVIALAISLITQVIALHRWIEKGRPE
jgi:O-antigen/teichoic acid export membrane protein